MVSRNGGVGDGSVGPVDGAADGSKPVDLPVSRENPLPPADTVSPADTAPPTDAVLSTTPTVDNNHDTCSTALTINLGQTMQVWIDTSKAKQDHTMPGDCTGLPEVVIRYTNFNGSSVTINCDTGGGSIGVYHGASICPPLLGNFTVRPCTGSAGGTTQQLGQGTGYILVCRESAEPPARLILKPN